MQYISPIRRDALEILDKLLRKKISHSTQIINARGKSFSRPASEQHETLKHDRLTRLPRAPPLFPDTIDYGHMTLTLLSPSFRKFS